MKAQIELDSISYWQDKLHEEIMAERRQRARANAESIIVMVVFAGLGGGAYYAYSSGLFAEVDVVGGIEFVREVLATVAFNVSEFMRNFS